MEIYDHGHFHETLLHCFCDNMGVLTHVKELMTPSTLHRNNNTNNDRSVLHCSPLQPSFLHVKGHQDKDPNRPLTIIKQFNIDCDHHAKVYTQMATQSSTALGNPVIPTALPHLYIEGKLICRKLPTALRHATQYPPYCKYLQQKLQ